MQMYADIRQELDAGGRAYFVYPLVEESTSEMMASVKVSSQLLNSLLSQQAVVLADTLCPVTCQPYGNALSHANHTVMSCHMPTMQSCPVPHGETVVNSVALATK